MNTFNPNSTPSGNEVSLQEQRLTDAMEEYLLAIEAGEPINRSEFLRRHHELEPRLSAAMESIEFLNVCAPATFANSGLHSIDATDLTNGLQVLGDFRLMREIGRGGMGVVYEAHQNSLNRHVAVKVLPFAALLDQTRIERFQNESRAAAMLKHPNIVRVFSVGFERGIHFYAMELIEGQSLASLIRSLSGASADVKKKQLSHERPNDEDRPRERSSATSDTSPVGQLSTDYSSNKTSFYRGVVELGLQVCNAMHYAHQQGIIHRDIKPSNLLIDRGGSVHVADFGLARIQTQGDLTVTGDVVGTIRYMSPEQLDGQPIDERADIYSLGITLYELATGKPAFPAKHRRELTQQVLDAGLLPPSKLDSSIPRDLESIIMKATAKSASDRYATADEFGQDLQRFLDGEPVAAKNPGVLEVSRRWIGRNRVVTALAAAVVLLLAAFALSSFATARKLQRAANALQVKNYSQAMQLAHQVAQAGDFVTAEEILFRWVPEKGQTDRRDFEWYYIWKLCHNPAVERTFQQLTPVHEVRFIDPSRVLVARNFSSQMPIWDLQRDARLPQAGAVKMGGGRKLLPLTEESRLFVGGSNGSLTEVDLKTSKIIRTEKLNLPHNHDACTSLSVNPTRELVAVGTGGSGAGHLTIWDRQLSLMRYVPIEFEGNCRAHFGSDNLVYATFTGDNQIRVIEPMSGHEISKFPVPVDNVRDLVTSKDKSRLFIIANPRHGDQSFGHVLVVDILQNEFLSQTVISPHALQSISISNNGKLIALGDARGGISLVDASSLTLLRRQQGHASGVNSIDFAPDDARLATGSSDNLAHIWDVGNLLESASSGVTLKGPTAGLSGAEFVSDQVVVTADETGKLYFCDRESGVADTILDLPIEETNWHQLAVSPDQSLVAVVCGLWPPAPKPGRLHLVDGHKRQLLWSANVTPTVAFSTSSFSPDGKLLAIAAWSKIVLFDVAKQHIAFQFEQRMMGRGYKSTAFSPDGRWFACGDTKGRIELFELPDFKRVRSIDTGSEVCDDLEFTPGSTGIICGISDGHLKVFSIATGEQLTPNFEKTRTFQVFNRLSPNGRRILSSGWDGRVHLWNAESGDLLLTLNLPFGSYSTGGFSPSGKSIVVIAREAHAFTSVVPESLSKLSKSELRDVSCADVSEAPVR